MTDSAERAPIDHDVPAACAGCARPDRRAFLNTASVLSLGAILAACGDGVISGPEAYLDILRDPVRIDPRSYPELQQVGGRVVITPEGSAPMLVENTGAGAYRAFSLVCPHRGTIVNPTSSGFLCPNHGAQFARNGVWAGGQATVDLSPIAVSIEPDGALLVGGIVLPPSPPILALSRTSVSFSATIGGSAPAAQSVEITNTGGGRLTGMTFSLTYADGQPSGWLAATLSSLAAPATLSLSVARGALGAGSYSATIRVSAPGTGNADQLINVTLVVIDSSTPPAIQLSSSALAFAATLGNNPAAQTVQVINSGSGTVGALAFSVAYGAGASGWLAATSMGIASTPSTLTVRASVSGLQIGTYAATITVTGAGVAPRTLAVSLTVGVDGLAVTIADWPALANVGGVVGSVGSINFNPVAVVRTGANSFAAFSLICPHAGFYVQVVNNASFRCPNHGSLFNANGSLAANSPIQTGSLQSLRVTYTPGDPVLYVG